VIKGLTKDDFELYEGGKKQLINFFEFVDAGKDRRPGSVPKEHEQASQQGPSTPRIVRSSMTKAKMRLISVASQSTSDGCMEKELKRGKSSLPDG
jgi:hypothetical protein